jgi:uncharacterized protein YyaL (SSP411 family)
MALPGLPPFDATLLARLEAEAARDPVQAARTKLRRADGHPKYINRLILEPSPYLQQHAFNPVNWYPWGAEALAAAARENKPIFLSIGYSTCHWCHVMEEESFDDERVARLLNERFIAIKVDREERPDLDNAYIAAVQRLTGSAGWPLNVFLTPAGEPFYGGTYFPPENRYGRPGFTKLLTTIADAWASKHEQVLAAAADLTRALHQADGSAQTVNLTELALTAAAASLMRGFDAQHGGFGSAPKFPQAHTLQFLLRDWSRRGDAQSLRMATQTLEQMAAGGIHDQLGGGFHRYSTDAEWFVPHYEKMLYDQASNAHAYLEAYQATQRADFARVARDIFAYVLRDLTDPGGGFYAAEDADSEGEEGRFYVWSRPQVIAALGEARGAKIADYYGLGKARADGAEGQPLRVVVPAAEFAKHEATDAGTFAQTLTDSRIRLLAVRSQRPRPQRDDKIITAWNGLMISSLAYGAAVLGDAAYATAAARAADFVLTRVQRDGRLQRSFRNGAAPTPAYLDDYAFFIDGLIDLYEATLETRWLREADRLARDMLRLFADPAGSGLRFSGSDHAALSIPSDDPGDGALPSAHSAAALALLRLGRLTMNEAFERQGRAELAARSQDLATTPAAFTAMLLALDFALGPVKEIVVAGPPDAAGTQALLHQVRRRYLPRAVLALHAPGDAAIEQLVPFLAKLTMTDGQPTAYVCENYVCKLPTHDPQRLERLLAGERPAK